MKNQQTSDGIYSKSNRDSGIIIGIVWIGGVVCLAVSWFTSALHAHFKRNLGDDYLRFYSEWFVYLAVPIGIVAIAMIALTLYRLRGAL